MRACNPTYQLEIECKLREHNCSALKLPVLRMSTLDANLMPQLECCFQAIMGRNGSLGFIPLG